MRTDQRGSAGVIGLGNMGLPMARTLVRKGFTVFGYDVLAERCELAAASGVVVCSGVPEVMGATAYTVLSLPTAREVEEVVEAAGALLGRGQRDRAIVIDTSTSEPDVSRRLSTRLAAAGHGFLDAPVSGAPIGAAAGTLTMMIGGVEADVAYARPVIEALASKIMHVGPSGAGNVAKLVNNLLVAAHMVATGEALHLATAAGLDAESALRVINASTGRSAISEVHFPNWIMSNRFECGYTMGLMRKDVRLVLDIAQQAGVALPLGEHVANLWLESSDRLDDAEDFTRMGAFTDPSAADS